ncbi:hypothetical protein DFH07DRAFT_893147 [Mycena maculata]|uniref:Uncharacterized protein n=1 Tax=Mycena maculata TaxID=230809 RepID=A0AAD7I956_9AGAR|nr:hypothetical protein DFH07DRAFT_893147 [Mycena maculata]
MSQPIIDDPSPDVVMERSLYWGQFFATALYGIDVFMFLHSAQLSWSSDPKSPRKQRAYILFGALLLTLLTISVFTSSVFLEFMWIDDRDAPGGPLGFLALNSAVWWQTLGTASTQVTNFLGDGLLMYRCYMMWNSRLAVVAFPFIIYLGTIAMAMVMLVQSALPGSDFFRGQTVNYGVLWGTLSVALNVTLTALITFRILRARQAIKRHQDSAKSLGIYVGIAAILIESSLPFSVLGIIFVVTYGKNLPTAPAFLFIWTTFIALSPQFIIFRVATGRAWNRDVASNLSAHSDMVFKHTTQNSESFQLSTAVVSQMESREHIERGDKGGLVEFKGDGV